MILFIIIVALAGLGVAVVNALFNNPWGVFSIAMTIPIAMCIGVYMFKIKPGAIFSGTIAGFILVCAAVLVGPFVADSGIAPGLSSVRRKCPYSCPSMAFLQQPFPSGSF